MTDLRELLPLYALGALDASEAAAVERAVAADPALAAELASYRDTAHRLVDLVTPVTPPADLEARLLASAGGGRYERFAARVAAIFDVTVDGAREILGLAERPSSWEALFPGIGLVHFQGGPACVAAAADCGIVRIDPGCKFPWHMHRGEEVTLILAGTLGDHEGRTLHVGDEVVLAGGAAHDLTCVGDAPVIFIARANGGVVLSTRS